MRYFVSGLIISLLSIIMATGENLLPNGDFAKTGANGFPEDWKKNYVGPHNQFTAELLPDASRKSNYLKLEISTAKNQNAVGYGHCYSNDIELKMTKDSIQGLFLNVSGVIKLEDVIPVGNSGWKEAYIKIDFYDSAKKKLQGVNIVSSTGNQDWTAISRKILVPEKTDTFRFICGIANCTGKVYFKDLKIIRDTNTIGFDENVKAPYLVPEPWQKKCSGQLLTVKDINIFSPSGEFHPTNRSELEELLAGLCGKKPMFTREETSKTDLLIASVKCSYVENYLKERKLEVPWKELGAQGYFLDIDNRDGRTSILITGNTDQGIFYGIQTLKQLVSADGRQVYQAQITDRPLFKERGLYTGPWWGPFSKGEVDVVKRMSSYKMNFLHVGGIGANKIQEKFRAPFTEREKKELMDILAYCEKHFVTLEVFFAPAQYSKPPITFSSEEDVGILFKKIDTLCEMGFRNFSLCFDDLENVKHNCLYNESDKKVFRNYGQAHASLIKKTYDHLKAKGKEYILRCTLTTYYHGETYWTPERLEYINELNKLPEDIPFFVCQSDFKDSASLEKYLSIVKRKPLLLGTWACYERFNKVPMILPAFGNNRGQSIFQDQYKYADEITYLVLTPRQEDSANISFASSADFAWNPVAYDPVKSAQRQLIRAIGAADKMEAVKKLNDLCLMSLPCPLPDKGNKQGRLDYVSDLFKRMDEELNKLKGQKVYDALATDVAVVRKKYEQLMKYEAARELFPFPIPRCAESPAIDGDLNDNCWKDAAVIPNLLALGKNLNPAVPATQVRLTYDDKNFYIGFTCDEPEPGKMLGQFNKRNDPVFHDDCVEIFLDIMQNREVLHIAINGNNAVYDAKTGNNLWHGNYATAVKKYADKWQAETAIPFATLGIPVPGPGTRWNINLGRERRVGGNSYSAWAYLPGGGFGQPYRFETIEFK